MSLKDFKRENAEVALATATRKPAIRQHTLSHSRVSVPRGSGLRSANTHWGHRSARPDPHSAGVSRVSRMQIKCLPQVLPLISS